jgi:hypothetical protein
MNKQGVSLIEMMVLLMVMTMVVVSGTYTFGWLNKVQSTAFEMLTATGLANQEIELIRANAINNNGNYTKQYKKFVISVNKTGYAGTELDRVEIKVSWKKPGKKQGEFVLTTLM